MSAPLPSQEFQRFAPAGRGAHFSTERLEIVDHPHLPGNRAIEPAVLRFQFIEPTHVGHVHTAELVAERVPPTMERPLCRSRAIALNPCRTAA
ncbi:hypothetical protein [Burkholderia pyrrocinia]|uniref:hypothetical protein n=1 Tax=Burkholderia pyrrocinia TaxID=60550 RepID=UPI00158D213A|nr:hypothetical protein [Burkholderia pyrrocinia]